MSDLLGIGASGLRAYSRALATIGDNIANAQTPGYARRTVALREMAAGGDPALLRTQVRPGGVDIAGITRATDLWLADEARLAAGDDARAELRFEAASAIETALADNSNGITTALTGLFTAADELGADPSNIALRGKFLDRVDQLASGFRTAASALERLAGQQSVAAATEVSALNADLQALEKVNDGLRRAKAGSTNEAGLLDERDRLLGQIAGRIDATATIGNHGTVTLRAASSGDLLVGAASFATIAATTAGDGRIAYSLSGQPLVIGSGSLAGIAEASALIASERSATDASAAAIAGQLNAAHQAGFDLSGQPGTALFSGGPSAANLQATALSASAVAAANTVSDNGNVRAFAALRGAGGPESLWSGQVSRQGQLAARARAETAAASIRFDQAAAARNAISEVDLDREAADLLRFQQAYTAAAQTIQVAREAMQVLFNAI